MAYGAVGRMMVRKRWLICVVLATAGSCTAANKQFNPRLNDGGTEGAADAADTAGSSSDIPLPVVDTAEPSPDVPLPVVDTGDPMPVVDAAALDQAPVDLMPDVAADLPPPVAGGPALH